MLRLVGIYMTSMVKFSIRFFYPLLSVLCIIMKVPRVRLGGTTLSPAAVNTYI